MRHIYWKVDFALHDLHEIEESLLNGTNVHQHARTETRMLQEVPVKLPPDAQADNIATDGDLEFGSGLIYVYRDPSAGFTHLNGTPVLCPGDCIRNEFDHRPGYPERRTWLTVLTVTQVR